MPLTKSQRVILIQDIAGRMAADDWTTIDLILKQFSFPTSDEWSSDKKSYIVEMVGNANNSDLMELAEHFGMGAGGSSASPGVEPDTPYWEDGELRVFVSHLTSSKTKAASLQTALGRYGMSCFVAHNDIHPTLEWQLEIENALSTCELLVALIHPDFVSSQWCDQEVGYALGRGLPVFAVSCGADPHGFVSRFQAFAGIGKKSPEIAKELFEAAIIHKKLQTKMADVLVDRFVNSGSFAAAKERIGYLEQLKVWDTSYAARLKKAVSGNSQISGSWGVPERVTHLLKKWK